MSIYWKIPLARVLKGRLLKIAELQDMMRRRKVRGWRKIKEELRRIGVNSPCD